MSRLLSFFLLVVSTPAHTSAAAWLHGDIVGAMGSLRAEYEDTLAQLANEHGLGFQEVLDANPGVDAWIPGAGREVRLPTAHVLPDAPREGIVINLAEYRLYHFHAEGVRTYPIGLGRDELRTPLMETEIIAHIENPSWTPTAKARREHEERGTPLPPVVPPGPDNPLGQFALQLARKGYFIHGTNKPHGVGQMVSHGCIRLYEDHIETLSREAANGTKVRVIYQTLKIGSRGDQVYAEVHRGPYENHDAEELERRMHLWGASNGVLLSAAMVRLAAHQRTGVPVPLN